MLDSIVVPVDFGPDGDRAARVAGKLAATAGLPVELLTVAGLDASPPVTRFELEYRERLLGQAHSSSKVIVDDDVVGALTRAVEARPSSLVVLGTRARGPISSLLLGGVAESVLARYDHPLLLVGPHADDVVGPNLVVAVADANAGAALLPSVVSWARQLEMEPWFVQVAPKEPHWWDRPVDLVEPGAVAQLASTARALGVEAQWDVLHGDEPAVAIQDFVASMGGGVVAVASRRWASDSRVHWTSTARSLVHDGRFPVLVQPLHDHASALASA